MKYLILTSLFIHSLLAKVDPPNYDFSLNSFSIFEPRNQIAPALKKYPKYKIVKNKGGLATYRFYISQLRYKFPVLVQVQNNIITDFYATLPSYFLHDIFHQSLINRYGKQDKYFKKEEAAIYIWNKNKKVKRVYSGTCTITCFPIFYSAQLIPQANEKTYKSLFDSMN